MPSDAVRAAIDGANTAIAEAISRQSAMDVAAHYTEDAVVLPPGSSPVVGQDAISDWMATAFGLGMCWIETMQDQLRSAGDELCVEQGRYRIGAGPDAVSDTGVYTVYWRKCGDTWCVARDIIMSTAG